MLPGNFYSAAEFKGSQVARPRPSGGSALPALARRVYLYQTPRNQMAEPRRDSGSSAAGAIVAVVAIIAIVVLIYFVFLRGGGTPDRIDADININPPSTGQTAPAPAQ
jgi:hypothetical protein